MRVGNQRLPPRIKDFVLCVLMIDSNLVLLRIREELLKSCFHVYLYVIYLKNEVSILRASTVRVRGP